MIFWWKKGKQPPDVRNQRGIQEAVYARDQANKLLKDTLDNQAEVQRVVNESKELRLTNHFGEDLQRALMRKRNA